MKTSMLASLSLATVALAMANEGGGGGAPVEPAFHVHAEGPEGMIALDANGRIITDLNERPEWAHGLAVAMLNERKDFYTKRLGEALAKDHLAQNVLMVEDLYWVAFDTEGDEVEVEANNEYRIQVLATAFGVDGEGEIHGAIAEKEIAMDNRGWEPEAAIQDANAQTRTGTQG